MLRNPSYPVDLSIPWSWFVRNLPVSTLASYTHCSITAKNRYDLKKGVRNRKSQVGTQWEGAVSAEVKWLEEMSMGATARPSGARAMWQVSRRADWPSRPSDANQARTERPSWRQLRAWQQTQGPSQGSLGNWLPTHEATSVRGGTAHPATVQGPLPHQRPTALLLRGSGRVWRGWAFLPKYTKQLTKRTCKLTWLEWFYWSRLKIWGFFSFSDYPSGGRLMSEANHRLLREKWRSYIFRYTCLSVAGVSLILAILYSSFKNNINVNGPIAGRI